MLPFTATVWVALWLCPSFDLRRTNSEEGTKISAPPLINEVNHHLLHFLLIFLLIWEKNIIINALGMEETHRI